MIDPTHRDAPYIQVAKILADRIRSGVYAKDHRIPAESALMEEFSIGRSTARKAVAWLRDQGLVETEPQRGTYVV